MKLDQESIRNRTKKVHIKEDISPKSSKSKHKLSRNHSKKSIDTIPLNLESSNKDRKN